MIETPTSVPDTDEDESADNDWSARRKLPPTARGARTRVALIKAARVVFERDGFLDSRLSDISAEAKCSTGSFYTYFDSKEDILTAVLEEAHHDMLHPGVPRLAPEADPVAVIEASHRAYFEAYQRNAKLMLVFEQVATINPHFRAMRGDRGKAFRERNARSIADLQERELADPDLDPSTTALALNAMMGRLAYHVFALELEPELGIDELVDLATRLWVNALKVSPKPGSTQ